MKLKLNIIPIMYSENDFEEDSKHENGNYQITCLKCGIDFIGHKRRTICKKCLKNQKIEK